MNEENDSSQLIKRIAELEDRLEIYGTDLRGNKVHMGNWDGIACRDETIRLKRERIAELESQRNRANERCNELFIQNRDFAGRIDGLERQVEDYKGCVIADTRRIAELEEEQKEILESHDWEQNRAIEFERKCRELEAERDQLAAQIKANSIYWKKKLEQEQRINAGLHELGNQLAASLETARKALRLSRKWHCVREEDMTEERINEYNLDHGVISATLEERLTAEIDQSVENLDRVAEEAIFSEKGKAALEERDTDHCPSCGEYLHDEMGHMCPPTRQYDYCETDEVAEHLRREERDRAIRQELFVVEHESGEWIDTTGGDVDYSVFTSRAEAQDALDCHADACEESRDEYKVVRFLREYGLEG